MPAPPAPPVGPELLNRGLAKWRCVVHVKDTLDFFRLTKKNVKILKKFPITFH